MYRKSLGSKLDESHITSSSPTNPKKEKTDASPAIDEKDDADLNSELSRMMGWALTVCLHLLVISSLFYSFGYSALDSDAHNWDLPQLAAATSIWIYLGAFCTSSSFSSSPVTPLSTRSLLTAAVPVCPGGPRGDLCSWEPTHFTRTLYAFAITFPTLSIIFSSVGILRAISMYLARDWTSADGVFLLICLYSLNIFFTGLLAMGMHLPAHYQHLLHHHHHRNINRRAKAKNPVPTKEELIEKEREREMEREKEREKLEKEEHDREQAKEKEQLQHHIMEEHLRWLKESRQKEEELPASIRQAIPG